MYCSSKELGSLTLLWQSSPTMTVIIQALIWHFMRPYTEGNVGLLYIRVRLEIGSPDVLIMYNGESIS